MAVDGTAVAAVVVCLLSVLFLVCWCACCVCVCFVDDADYCSSCSCRVLVVEAGFCFWRRHLSVDAAPGVCEAVLLLQKPHVISRPSMTSKAQKVRTSTRTPLSTRPALLNKASAAQQSFSYLTTSPPLNMHPAPRTLNHLSTPHPLTPRPPPCALRRATDERNAGTVGGVGWGNGDEGARGIRCLARHLKSRCQPAG